MSRVAKSSFFWIGGYIGVSLLLLYFFPMNEALIFLPSILGLLFLGMPHGASDLFTLHRLAEKKSRWLVLITLYVVVAALSFWFAQEFSFVFWCLFFIISYLHFFYIENLSIRHSGLFMPDLAFASIFILPLIKQAEFVEYMSALGSPEFAWFFFSVKGVWIGLFFLLCLWRLFAYSGRLCHLVYLIAFGLGFYFLPIWLSFFSFFIFLHSRRHLELFLEKQMNPRQVFWRGLMPLSAVSVAASLALVVQLEHLGASLILGLACLTIPHFLLERFESVWSSSGRTRSLNAR